jgi:hypothetical protein
MAREVSSSFAVSSIVERIKFEIHVGLILFIQTLHILGYESLLGTSVFVSGTCIEPFLKKKLY